MAITISEAISAYKLYGEYFSPDYEQENSVLCTFKSDHPEIDTDLAQKLSIILCENAIGVEQFFVADLLYLYPSFPHLLLDPMLNCAISYHDASFNRVFLRPCISSFGIQQVAQTLQKKFIEGNLLTKIGISNLIYWLRNDSHIDLAELHNTIIAEANKSENLVEKYFYNLAYAGEIIDGHLLPTNAKELLKAVGNDKNHIDFLRKLNWI